MSLFLNPLVGSGGVLHVQRRRGAVSGHELRSRAQHENQLESSVLPLFFPWGGKPTMVMLRSDPRRGLRSSIVYLDTVDKCAIASWADAPATH